MIAIMFFWGRSRRALLIEDDTAMARTVDLLLQGEGWRAPISQAQGDPGLLVLISKRLK